MAADAESVAARPLSLVMLIAAPLVSVSVDGQIVRPVVTLATQQEVDAIADACAALDDLIAVTIQPEIATTDSLGRLLATRTTPIDILHFTGHGTDPTQGAALVLENELGATRMLDAASFAAMLAPLAGPPCQLAFLSACHSQGMAQALLNAGVPHVVVINADDPILDIAARRFAERFYPSLLAGRSVADAFAFARTTVLTDDTLSTLFDAETFRTVSVREAAKFRLLPEDSAIHQTPITLPQHPGTPLVQRKPWQQTNLDRSGHDPFVGRSREQYEVGLLLRDQRCVHLHGYGGMGKTALAEAVGRWQHERARWRDGVWIARLRNVTTAAQARAQITTALELDPKVAESDAILAAALGEQRRLLILDDLDVLLQTDRAATVALLQKLLTARRVTLLTTSRRDLPGTLHHQALELSRLNAQDTLTAFRSYAAPVETWGDYTHHDIERLLTFLDGYPFPIRLAARYLSETRCRLRTLIERLEANPQGTLRYPGDEEDRDTSLAATLDLSYHALPADAQTIFPLLSLFPAGMSRSMASSVLGEDAEQHLETLVQHSMAEYRDEAGYQRFALPEPARRYAEARLPSGAIAQYAPAALSALFGLVEQGDQLITSGNNAVGRLVLTLEQPNLRRFLRWGAAHEESDQATSWTARTTSLLRNYWTLIGATAHPEIYPLLEGALKAAERLGDRLGEANTLRAIGDVQ